LHNQEKTLEHSKQPQSLNMIPSIKICGVNSTEALETALDCGADLIGFVFFPPSPRHIGFELASTLGAWVKGRAAKVALTVNADDAMLQEIVRVLKPDILQLHGTETPERVVAVRERFRLRVIKALPIAERQDLSSIPIFAKVADQLLFDARAPKEATRPGGLGQVFDWHLLNNIEPDTPYILSGGLNISNVAEAIKITHPWGIDVSSGVERFSGRKDPEMIKAFIQAVRAVTGEEI
jgi:phosphoribosylanthranilate isomerase